MINVIDTYASHHGDNLNGYLMPLRRGLNLVIYKYLQCIIIPTYLQLMGRQALCLQCAKMTLQHFVLLSSLSNPQLK